VRILIVAEDLESDSAAHGARRASLARKAAEVAQRAILVCGAPAATRLDAETRAGFERVLAMDVDSLLHQIALDGVVREFEPRAIVALGGQAAVAAGQLAAGVPLWIDFDQDPFVTPSWAALPGEADPGLWYAHRLLWAIDRADVVSCSDAVVRRALAAALLLRRQGGASAAPVDLASDPESVPETFVGWCRAPVRRPAVGRILGQAEIADWVRSSALERELGRLAHRLSGRSARLAARLAAGLQRAARAASDRAAAAVRWPGLALRCLGLRLGARLRSRRSTMHVAEPDASSLQLGRPPRVLVVMPYRVFPPRHGGAARLLAQLRALAGRCEIHLLRLDQRGESRVERDELEKYCRRVEFHHWQVPARGAPRAGALPPNAWVFADEALAWRIRRWVATERIDVVQFECAEMAQYLPAAAPARTILVEYDIAFRSLARRRELDLARRFDDRRFQAADLRDQWRLFAYEVASTRRADEVQMVSAEDARTLAALQPDGFRRLRVIPNAIDVAAFVPPARGPAARSGVLFVGNFEHLPNRDALEWLLRDIWPRVRERDPAARLSVAGARLPESARTWQGRDGVEILGEVEDLAALYWRQRVVAVPIRAGSGTRLKILEAFAAGAPVVSTTLGAEGLEVEGGRHLLLADGAREFAEQVVRLLRDDGLASTLSAAAANLVRERYDVAQSSELAYASIARLAARGPGASPAAVPAIAPGPPVAVSVILPTLDGGVLLRRTLDALGAQQFADGFEIVCVDSGSPAADLEAMAAAGARVIRIDQRDFNHGATRDLGARASRGRVLVFLNQDAVPADERWLERLTAPFTAPVAPAAVQGGIREFAGDDPRAPRRLYWDSGGPRFNFTRESRNWIARHDGIGFSTVNCAIRREVWEKIPFGWMPILEDKLWQARAREREYRIVAVPEAAVFHTHDYDLGGLIRRSWAEGEGWRRLGERYFLRDALADAFDPGVWRDWQAGRRARRLRSSAEWLFPFARPYGLWRGNRAAAREIR